jgi:hypothetical protein
MGWWEDQHDKVTYEGLTALRRRSTMHYFKDREDAVRFVAARLRRSQRDCVLTITIEPEKSGGCSVTIVTDASSVGTPTPNSSKGLDVT